MKILRTLVVEDEELARERLARLLDGRADLDVVAVCRNCDEAEKVIDTQPVDLALLDIQMPGTNGMRFSQKLRARGDAAPVVIFVTAHRRFACDAFEIQAADYLLKPFDQERLDRALDAARERVQARHALTLVRQLQDTVSDSEPAPPRKPAATAERIMVRENGRILIVRSDRIDWIEADGRDCILHCGKKMHRIAGPFAELSARLCADRFVQVSRSSLVNIDAIAQLQEMFKGDLVAVMRDGQEVAVSRRFRAGVMGRLAS
ncbi:MAG TPA: LytTR family DNA-binding domain-containing protein [Rudaea sp.]